MVTSAVTGDEPISESSSPTHTHWHVLLGGIQQPLLNNVFFKCFASHKRQREAAFAVMNQMRLWTWSEELWAMVNGLQAVFQRLEGEEMKAPVLTPEYLRKLGEGMREQIIATLSVEERLAGLAPEVIESYLSKQQVKNKPGRATKAKSGQRKPKKTKVLPS